MYEIDPSKDREEFEKRLQYLLSKKNVIHDYVEALIDGDTARCDCIRDDRARAKAKLAEYLSQWDAASNLEERKRIVGSVKM